MSVSVFGACLATWGFFGAGVAKDASAASSLSVVRFASLFEVAMFALVQRNQNADIKIAVIEKSSATKCLC